MRPSIPHFQPQPILTIAAVLLIVIFTGLGFWQLERAEQKRILAETRISRLDLAPLQLTEQNAAGIDLEFRTLKAQGVFIPEKSIFIEHRKHMGKSGFHIITPLRILGGRHLLVNRGWVEARKDQLIPSVPTPDSTVIVTGVAYTPQPPALELGKHEQSANASPRWPYLTLDRYRRWSGLEIFPFVLLQSADDQHGFVRSWQQEIPKEGMHIGYAIQWFAFALIVLLIWLRLSWQRPPGKGIDQDDNGNH